MCSKIPTTLLLWDQFTDHEGEIMSQLEGQFPIVIGFRMKVNTFQGKQWLQPLFEKMINDVK